MQLKFSVQSQYGIANNNVVIMKKYNKPKIEIYEIGVELLSLSEDGPPAIINPPGIEGGHTSLSIWDDDEYY